MDYSVSQVITYGIGAYLLIALIVYVVGAIIRIRTADDEADIREVFSTIPLVAIAWIIVGPLALIGVVIVGMGALREWIVKRIMRAKGWR